jgi:hypothetical protein
MDAGSGREYRRFVESEDVIALSRGSGPRSVLTLEHY